MPVVSNSSPLIALVRIQRLDLVPAILESVLIPPAVAREIRPSIPDLPDWLRVRPPSTSPSRLGSRGRLGDGEWEAIALAIEIGASAILVDDRPARVLARQAGLNVIGTLGLLLEAKSAGAAELDPMIGPTPEMLFDKEVDRLRTGALVIPILDELDRASAKFQISEMAAGRPEDEGVEFVRLREARIDRDHPLYTGHQLREGRQAAAAGAARPKLRARHQSRRAD